MKISRWLPLALIALFLPLLAHAATVTVAWTAPAAASDGSPLTGQQVITGYQIWVSTSSIPANTTSQPTATITGTATTTTQAITASPGSTIFARVKACNAAGCSDFSTEGSKALPITAPGVPTAVTVTVSLQ